MDFFNVKQCGLQFIESSAIVFIVFIHESVVKIIIQYGKDLFTEYMSLTNSHNCEKEWRAQSLIYAFTKSQCERYSIENMTIGIIIVFHVDTWYICLGECHFNKHKCQSCVVHLKLV